MSRLTAKFDLEGCVFLANRYLFRLAPLFTTQCSDFYGQFETKHISRCVTAKPIRPLPASSGTSRITTFGFV